MAPKPINFAPNQADQKAIDEIRTNHPNLVNTADLLRYCLHLVRSIEGENWQPVIPRSQEEIEQLRQRIEGHYSKLVTR